MDKYKCSICGKSHDYYGSFPTMSMPDIINKLSEAEKEQLIKMHDFFYHLEGFFFICKGDLFIKVIDQDWFIHWEIWAKIEESDFYTTFNNLDSVSNHQVRAELISPVFQYNVPINTPINLIFNFKDKNSYPEVHFTDKYNEIGKDFFNGITIEKLNTWMNNIYHP